MIYLVIAPGSLILAAYEHERHAAVHARTITGALAMPVEVLPAIALSTHDDINAEWESDQDTPIELQPIGPRK